MNGHSLAKSTLEFQLHATIFDLAAINRKIRALEDRAAVQKLLKNPEKAPLSSSTLTTHNPIQTPYRHATPSTAQNSSSVVLSPMQQILKPL